MKQSSIRKNKSKQKVCIYKNGKKTCKNKLSRKSILGLSTSLNGSSINA